jgi:uncharacterized membrane protein YebE (DUF533 family)
MKNLYIFSLLVITSLTGCATKTQTGALTGAGVGALAGGLIGGNAAGALIGGAVGAAGGALIGYALDQQDRDNLQQQSPQTLNRIDHGQELSVNDIKAMSKAGIKDEVIISQIHSTHSIFHLSADQIIDLKDSGVSQNVIDAMIQTGNP